ncbi:glycine zipper domain-containing protein [Lelliottia amnigena]|uniref:glycine zipper domain-containing protein n=1 Tax=Lelliottia amnigena TaxID=61646 RepID=UPI002B234DD5|nr:glycine zipper domain-containing protein [Lelliottia amnigena]MEA9394656.1 glycine zipper domain-containing protein [Lelliottia amnigena]
MSIFQCYLSEAKMFNKINGINGFFNRPGLPGENDPLKPSGGAVVGAKVGAVIGSKVPVVGVVVGAAIGGVIGFLCEDEVHRKG